MCDRQERRVRSANTPAWRHLGTDGQVETSAGPQIRTAEKYCSEVQEWRDRVPHNGSACAQSLSRGTHSGILQAGG